MRYFIEFSYKGANYHGWQIQPNAVTVQEVLENRLSTLLKTPIQVTGAGRTDAGVHAKQMFAHADLDCQEPEVLKNRLNRFLPDDIAVHQIIPVKEDAHARFDALSRTYEYYIFTKKNVFETENAWIMHHSLDIDAMNEAAKQLFLYEDFTSFARLHADTKTNICKIYSAIWEQNGDELKFTICADRFLRNMVRAIVGTMVEVGKGKINITEFKQIIEKKGRNFAAASAPAQGLFLTHVAYPSDLFYV
ncbi:tRNA pseudouridine(38-40) synthase TruA [Ornithobacterium rhinotracheale]|uniref:tRNA pseudouridine(38-40) synthase TruA n=1 Tax=Ornithobacterium rhinotracheale TaxID=28251 RepID=UPI004035EF66